jgi:diadenosine tetraphosphatase ApaH/serine/threonine PP2A family protein phosphatase
VRVAALYDVHGNLPALEAVLAELERGGGADEIVVGGDVLWGPLQAECLELLRGVGATFVSGNCERDVMHPTSDVDRWCHQQLGEADRSFVASWPAVAEFDVEGLGSVVFCHATPRDDEEILTRITPDLSVAAALAGIDAAVVVCGHTHVQFDRRVPESPRLVNAGSVGLAYEGVPGAFWALLGPDVELRRTEYDVEQALAELGRTGFLQQTGFPRFDEIFARSLEGRVTPEEATADFEGRRGA